MEKLRTAIVDMTGTRSVRRSPMGTCEFIVEGKDIDPLVSQSGRRAAIIRRMAVKHEGTGDKIKWLVENYNRSWANIETKGGGAQKEDAELPGEEGHSKNGTTQRKGSGATKVEPPGEERQNKKESKEAGSGDTKVELPHQMTQRKGSELPGEERHSENESKEAAQRKGSGTTKVELPREKQRKKREDTRHSKKESKEEGQRRKGNEGRLGHDFSAKCGCKRYNLGVNIADKLHEQGIESQPGPGGDNGKKSEAGCKRKGGGDNRYKHGTAGLRLEAECEVEK